MGLALTIAATVLGYVIGSVLFGLIACRPYGRDPRQHGSGRTGGSNVYRTAGLTPAVVTVVGDVLKGYLAVTAAGWLVPAASYGDSLQALAMALAALAAIIGHNHSLFAGFEGGAGTSPNLGALIALSASSFWLAVAVGLVVLLATRIASVASLSVSTAVLLIFLWRTTLGATLPGPFLVYAVGQLAIVGWALRPNIARLRAGTERHVSRTEGQPIAAGEAQRED